MTITNNTCAIVNATITFDACLIREEITKCKTLRKIDVVLLVALSSIFIWSIIKNVKLFQKFYKENIEPAILLELVFLTDFSCLFATTLLQKCTELSSIGLLNSVVCSLNFWTMMYLFADLCLIYFDKFIALYWSINYSDMAE